MVYLDQYPSRHLQRLYGTRISILYKMVEINYGSKKILIFVKIYSTCLSANNCVYSFIALKKKMCRDSIVKIHYAPIRKTAMFDNMSHRPQTMKDINDTPPRFDTTKVLQSHCLASSFHFLHLRFNSQSSLPLYGRHNSPPTLK